MRSKFALITLIIGLWSVLLVSINGVINYIYREEPDNIYSKIWPDFDNLEMWYEPEEPVNITSCQKLYKYDDEKFFIALEASEAKTPFEQYCIAQVLDDIYQFVDFNQVDRFWESRIATRLNVNHSKTFYQYHQKRLEKTPIKPIIDRYSPHVWYEHAAKAGYVPAMFEASEIFSSTRFHRVDKNKALFWLKLAVKNGNMKAEYSMGKQLIEGNILLKKDTKRGLTLITQAAEKGHGNAQRDLAWYYLEDTYSFYEVDIDRATAIHYLTDLSNNNDPEYEFDSAVGALELGKMYLYGTHSMEKDRTKARALFQAAKKNGLENAESMAFCSTLGSWFCYLTQPSWKKYGYIEKIKFFFWVITEGGMDPIETAGLIQ